MDRPDIYTDGERPERCANCNYARATVFRSVYGTERIEYECMRRPEFIHRTQGEAGATTGRRDERPPGDYRADQEDARER